MTEERFVAGVDVGGTNIEVGLVGADHRDGRPDQGRHPDRRTLTP